MLLSFEAANHKSFRGEHELQLMPARDKRGSAVCVAAIYGANASGKSNFLDALRFMSEAVLLSFRVWDAQGGIPRSPFRLSADGPAAPSSFVVQLEIDKVDYLYGFILDDTQVVEEWLYSYPHRKKRVIFERHGTEIRLGSTLSESASRLDLLQKLVRENSLVLSAAAQASHQDEFAPVYGWFRSGLQLLNLAGRSRRSFLAPQTIERALTQHPSFLELVRAADMGIADIRVERFLETAQGLSPGGRTRGDRLTQLAAGDLPRERREVIFFHGAEALPLPARDQSAGTLGWLEILPSALDCLDNGSVLVVDELDTSLHPRLLARLIELFHDERTNPSGAQLIFTTHDATLLGTSLGREVLAREEIWFTEKDAKNESSLIALTDFHPRKEDNREKRYLSGSYGGVPDVYSDTFVQAVIASREGTAHATA
jgi:hypothetical protein